MLEVAREPASPFPRPHFTGACVSRKIQSGFARVRASTLEEEENCFIGTVFANCNTRFSKVRSHKFAYNYH